MLKRLAIVAVFLAVTQTPVPTPGQTPDKGAYDRNDKTQTANASAHPSQSAMPVAAQDSSGNSLKPKSDSNSSNHQQTAINISNSAAVTEWTWHDKVSWFFGLVLTGFLVWGVIVARGTLKAIETQAGLMDKQWKEMQKASEIGNKTLILQYRPRITVRDVKAKVFSKEISEGGIGISKPVRCALSLQIVNTGGSPAHIVEGDIYLISARRGHPIEEAEVKESTHAGIGERTLQPGQWEIIEFGLNTGIPNDARWIELHKGVSSHSIILLGTIWYRDDLGIPRQTGLHREYDPETRIFVRRKDSEEEYSD